MNLKNKKIIRNGQVVFKTIDSKVLILDQKNSKLRELNETASLIWKYIAKPKSINEIAQKLATEFEVTNKDSLTDVINFVSLYYEQGLVDLV